MIKAWHVQWLSWGWHTIQDTNKMLTIKVRGPFRFVSMRLR